MARQTSCLRLQSANLGCSGRPREVASEATPRSAGRDEQDLRQREADNLKDEIGLDKTNSTFIASKVTQGGKIVLDTIVDQAEKTDLKALSEVDIAACYKRYSDRQVSAAGAPSVYLRADEEPPKEHLSGLPHVFSALYCDFQV